MTHSSIQTYALTGTGVVISLSIAANQTVFLYANQNLRLSYDEAELADNGHYFTANFKSTAEQLMPFIIPPNGAMTDQRALFIRTDATPTSLQVWYMGV